ncbi:MAG TPA: AraC family transcriptional regulator [Clostridiales bacterium]|nr:AraC family transcriptional regulator [Clostridiales bacterium]
MAHKALYKKPELPDFYFPIIIRRVRYNVQGPICDSHWHEQIEILFFIEADAVVECNFNEIKVKSRDIIYINSHELHRIHNPGGGVLEYYCIAFDPSLIQSSFFDSIDSKYILPIENNLILFKNIISKDPDIDRYIREMVWESETREEGYELSVKAYVYLVLVLMIRRFTETVLTKKEFQVRNNNLESLNKVIVYIEENYSEKITVDHLARYAGMSTSNLYLQFKKASGKTITDYINQVRIQNADRLLRSSDMNITEIASAVGIEDSNYFTKLFRKYKKVPPSQIRRKNRQNSSLS